MSIYPIYQPFCTPTMQQGTLLYQRDHHPNDYESSGHPPASCLLARQAYIDIRSNATTAYCQAKDLSRDDVTIQVTFVVAYPPRVSYFCAYCTGTGFFFDPIIVHTEGQLALLYLGVSTSEFYVYQPGEKPSLTLLPRPSGTIEYDQIGLLPPHGHSRHYHVATLLRAPGQLQQFELHIYNSKKKSWKVKKPVVQQQQVIHDDHRTRNVITIGGDRGTMGFVDPIRGIIFCDVLEGDYLYYVPLPEPLNPSRLTRRHPWRFCHFAVDTKGNNIRFVELDDVGTDDCGWQAIVWSTPIKRLRRQVKERWRLDGHFRSTQLVSGNLVELLPRVSPDSDGDQATPFSNLDLDSVLIELPTLSLHDDGTVYFLTRESIRHRDGWVIAVDMDKAMLQTVAQYLPERGNKLFRPSRISNHPCMAATTGAIGNLKRPGTPLLESSSCKKQCGIFRMDGMVSSWVVEHEQYGTTIGAEDEDNMDLDM